jgi:enoyl-CoA hydratase
MTFENLLWEVNDHILTLTINRPSKLNALNQQTMREISSAFNQIYQDNGIRGVIITGAGEKAFVAGADISEFIGMAGSVGGASQMIKKGHEIFFQIENCPKPVVAAVNGFALGGGCELAMACHFRIASENAKFGQPEVNLGIIPGYGGTQRLTQLVGKGRALELMMTADMIGAQEAHRIGLVNHVVTPDQVLAKAKEILVKITQKAPIAIAQVIESANAVYNKGYEAEANGFGMCAATEDFKEGASAFLEKRKANFQGK